MLNSRLLETLRCLQPEELLLLQRFVHSRFFFHEDNASGVQALFDDLLRGQPDFQHPDLHRKAIGQRLGYSEEYVVQLGSNLHNVVRRFIAYQHSPVAHDAFYQQLPLLQFYTARGLPERFDLLYKRLSGELEHPTTPRDFGYYDKKCALELSLMQHHYRYRLSSDANLVPYLEALEARELLLRANNIFLLLMRAGNNQSIDKEAFVRELPKMDVFLERYPPDTHQLIRLFTEAVRILLRQPGADVNRLQQQLTLDDSSIGHSERLLLHGLVRQNMQQAYNHGQYELLQPLFTLCREHLTAGYLYYEGDKIYPHAFLNLVRLGCQAGETAWVDDFIAAHEQRLLGLTHPDNLLALARAYVQLYRGEARNMTWLATYRFEDNLHNLLARRLELMAQYEQRFEAIEHRVEAFRKFLQNTPSLPPEQRDSNWQFALLLRKMLNPALRWNDKKIDALLHNMKGRPISEPGWVAAQLRALKRRNRDM